MYKFITQFIHRIKHILALCLSYKQKQIPPARFDLVLFYQAACAGQFGIPKAIRALFRLRYSHIMCEYQKLIAIRAARFRRREVYSRYFAGGAMRVRAVQKVKRGLYRQNIQENEKKGLSAFFLSKFILCVNTSII